MRFYNPDRVAAVLAKRMRTERRFIFSVCWTESECVVTAEADWVLRDIK